MLTVPVLQLGTSKLTHWGRVTHISVSKLIIIGSDNDLSPGRRQAIIWTNDGILLIGTLRTNFSEMLIEIRTFSFKKVGLKVSSAKWRPFCLGLNVLTCLLIIRLLASPGNHQLWSWYVRSIFSCLPPERVLYHFSAQNFYRLCNCMSYVC